MPLLALEGKVQCGHRVSTHSLRHAQNTDKHQVKSLTTTLCQFLVSFFLGGGGGEGQHGSFSSSVQYMVPSRRVGSLQVLLLPCLCVLFILFSLYVCCCATFAHPCSVLCVLTQFAMFQFVSSTMTHQKKAAVRFELEKALPSGEWWHLSLIHI